MKLLTIFSLLLSVPALATIYSGESATHVLERKGKNLQGTESFTVTLSPRIFRVQTQKQLVDEMDFGKCEKRNVKDAAGDWNGLFTAPFGEKAARLAASVKGLTLSTATKLIHEGYFAVRPESWFDFAFSLTQADEDYQSGFPFDVLVTFKKDNMIRLGYMKEDECDFEIKQVYRRVPVKRLERTAELNFSVQVKGAPLLASETETLQLLTDGFTHNLFVSSHYNDYEVTKTTDKGVVRFVVQGTRKLVRPANLLHAKAFRYKGRLQLSIKDGAFDREASENVARFVVGKVYEKGPGWTRAKEVGQLRERLEPEVDVTFLSDVGIALKANRHYRITYAVRYENSRYVSPVPSIRRNVRLRAE